MPNAKQEILRPRWRHVLTVKPNLFSVVAGLGVAGLLGGCMSPPQPSLDNNTPANWSHTSADTSAAQTVTTAGLQTWWQYFGDPELNALVEEALARNLSLGQTLDQLKSQQLLLGTAKAAYRPQVTAGVRTVQDIAAVDSYFHASIDMSFDLGLFGAEKSNQLAAYGEMLGVQAQWQQARVELVANVVLRYLDIRMAQRQQAALAQRVALDDRLVALAQIRVAQRIGSSDAVHQAQLERVQTQGQQAALVESQARAAYALAALLGRQTADPRWLQADAQATVPAAPTLQLKVLPAEMLRTRPQIQLAQARVEQAAGKLGLSRSALYPRFALGGSLLYSYNITQNLHTRSDQIPVLGPVIDIPLFDWGRRQSQADADQALMEGTVKAYRQSVLDGLADVESALAGLQAQTMRSQSLTQTQALLATREQVLQRRQKLGLASELNVLTERRALLQNAGEQSVAQSAQALAYVALFKSLGGAPLPEQIAADDRTTAQPAATATAKVDAP